MVLFALSAFLVVSSSYGEQGRIPSTPSISPVYEEMLGNQIGLLRRELAEKKIIRAGEPFSVSSWNEDEQALACQIAVYLQASRSETGAWPCAPVSPDQDYRGVILMQSDLGDESQSAFLESFERAAQFLSREGNIGFILAVLSRPLEHPDSLKTIANRSGLVIHTLMRESELEFLKDGSGRQALSLDSEEPRRRIYERLVRKGMNPISAEEARDRAIGRFRASEQVIFIVQKKDAA